MSEMCNHVVAALFRIEYAVGIGLNSPSCTSLSFQCLPAAKPFKPGKIKDLFLHRVNISSSTSKRSNAYTKKLFNPVSDRNFKKTSTWMAEAMNDIC